MKQQLIGKFIEKDDVERLGTQLLKEITVYVRAKIHSDDKRMACLFECQGRRHNEQLSFTIL